MKLRQVIFAIIALPFVLGMPSCATTELSQLEGEWRLFYINHLDDPNIYIWDFAESGDLIVTRFPLPSEEDPNPAPSIIGNGKFKKSAEFLDAVVTISEVVTTSAHLHSQMSSCCMADDSADWTILKINREHLRIGTADAGGYVMREFTREN